MKQLLLLSNSIVDSDVLGPLRGYYDSSFGLYSIMAPIAQRKTEIILGDCFWREARPSQ